MLGQHRTDILCLFGLLLQTLRLVTITLQNKKYRISYRVRLDQWLSTHIIILTISICYSYNKSLTLSTREPSLDVRCGATSTIAWHFLPISSEDKLLLDPGNSDSDISSTPSTPLADRVWYIIWFLLLWTKKYKIPKHLSSNAVETLASWCVPLIYSQASQQMRAVGPILGWCCPIVHPTYSYYQSND